MFRFYELFWVLSIVLMVYSLVEAISTDEARMRNLPKIAWILLILLFPFAGSIAWLAAGRPVVEQQRPGSAPSFPEYDRPGRALPNDPAKDDDFLRQVRERTEEQRLRYEKQKQQQAQEPDAEG